MTGLDFAYALHRRPFRNTSLLTELFTQDAGRIGAVARGARAAKSRWRGLLEPFVPLRVGWRGRGELYTLSRIEEAGPGARMAPKRLASAFYVNELVMRLTEREQALPGLFACYCRTLHALATDPEVESSLRLFEYDLLADLGLTLRLTEDSAHEPVVAAACYRYDPEGGPIPVVDSSRDSLGHVSGRSLLAFAARDLSSKQTRREVKRITRLAIERQLNGRPLHSRSLLREPRSG